MAADPVAEFLRREAARLTDLWVEMARRELPAIAGMANPVLVDHLPEVLEGIAHWIDGNTEEAERTFEALARGHALQRLGYAIPLETLTREYALVRIVLTTELLALPATDEVRRSLLRLNQAFDLAISRAIDRYTRRRDEVRERFIGILGHDLRGPLNTIVMAAQRLPSRSDFAEVAELGTRIGRAADRMRRMIDDVLDFARGQLGGGIPCDPSLNDMGEIAHAAVDEVAGAHPDRTIRARIEGDLRGPFDRDRVLQALGNLLTNAITYGTGDVELVAREEDDAQHLVTTVTSHGVTIPEDQLRRIFDPFARAGSAGQSTGVGLGLYIVEQIALAHGAVCDVSSQQGITTFSIRWPRVPGEQRLALAKD